MKDNLNPPDLFLLYNKKLQLKNTPFILFNKWGAVHLQIYDSYF